MVSGHTFRPHRDAAPRPFERWPDHRHDPRDGRHNPFGVWRFGAPGAQAPLAPDAATRLVISPPLVALLLAAEQTAGRALTAADVDEVVRTSAAIAVDPRRAQALERARGYADIEPERAWEQWQIVRRTLPGPAADAAS